jgi:alkanesulfonate monooxygenase SsuD/methylene tetrahydromethanopterin reductase-like flavin-dependent oxidoreductase (luciferase family)
LSRDIRRTQRCRPDDLARAAEQRGFESLFFAEHSHLLATSATEELVERVADGTDAAVRAPLQPFVAHFPAPTERVIVATGACLIP